MCTFVRVCLGSSLSLPSHNVTARLQRRLIGKETNSRDDHDRLKHSDIGTASLRHEVQGTGFLVDREHTDSTPPTGVRYLIRCILSHSRCILGRFSISVSPELTQDLQSGGKACRIYFGSKNYRGLSFIHNTCGFDNSRNTLVLMLNSMEYIKCK